MKKRLVNEESVATKSYDYIFSGEIYPDKITIVQTSRENGELSEQSVVGDIEVDMLSLNDGNFPEVNMITRADELNEASRLEARDIIVKAAIHLVDKYDLKKSAVIIYDRNSLGNEGKLLPIDEKLMEQTREVYPEIFK